MSNIIIISILLYSLACGFPAFVNKENQKTGYIGGICLLFGSLAFFYNVYAFLAWLGNIFYVCAIVGIILKFSHVFILINIILAVLLSLFTFKVKKLLANEAGAEFEAKVGMGAYIWILSIISLFLYFVL